MKSLHKCLHQLTDGAGGTWHGVERIELMMLLKALFTEGVIDTTEMEQLFLSDTRLGS